MLIHAIDTGKPIGMGLWTGWNPLKQDYTDRYSLDKLVDQDPLGEYTLCRTAPSPTTSTETETSSSPSKIEESSSDRESPVHSDLPQLVQESVAADNLPPAEGSRTYASVVPPKPPKEDSLSQKDSPTTEIQGGLRQRQRSPFKKNSEQPPAKATT